MSDRRWIAEGIVMRLGGWVIGSVIWFGLLGGPSEDVPASVVAGLVFSFAVGYGEWRGLDRAYTLRMPWR